MRLTRYLRVRDLEVIEIDRANRQLRRRAGKSDTIDAIEAGRAVLSCRASGLAKSADGNVEAIRALLIAKRSGRETRIRCLNPAPDALRERLRGVPRRRLAHSAATLRPTAGSDPVLYATKVALRTLGRQVLDLEDTAQRLDVMLDQLVRTTAPSLLELDGSVSTPLRSCWSRPATTRTASVPKPRGRTSVALRRSPRQAANEPNGIASTVAATAKRIMRSGGSCSLA